MTLALPSLGSVPRAYTRHGSSPLAAAVALVFLDQGVKPPKARDEAEALKGGIAGWLAGQMRGMKALDFAVHYHEGRQVSAFGDVSDDKAAEIIFSPPNGGWPAWLIGKRIPELERRHKGLGETALYWVEAAASKSFQVFTPAVALGAASWTWWMGEDDEKERINSIIEMGEDPDEITLPTRAQFDQAIPRYASAPQQRLKGPQIERLARQRGDASAVARAILEVAKAVKREKGKTFQEADHGMTRIACSCGLYWERGYGIAEQAWNDFCNEQMETGEMCEWLLRTGFDAGEIRESIPDWLSDMSHTFAVARPLDALIQLIGTRIGG